MIERTRKENVESRLLRLDGLMQYLSMGRASALKFARDAGAERKYGRARLYDRVILDKAIDQMSER